jgi:hypothetical protein
MIPLSSPRILVMVELPAHLRQFLGYGIVAHQPVRAICNRTIDELDLGRRRRRNEDNNTDDIPEARLLITHH